MSLLNLKHLQDEEAAYAWVEAQIWPHGPQCPHCFEKKRLSKMEGKSTRLGLYKCYACRKQFRVTVGTIFEKSHVRLHLWLQAFYLIAGSKKGISANQLHRTLGVTLKTAWFMGHRIREAMRHGTLAPPMGGLEKVVEIDETFIGKKCKPTHKASGRSGGYGHKHAVLTLIDREGEARSFHVEDCKVSTLGPIIQKNIDRESKVSTDEASYHRGLYKHFAEHDSVNHGKDEYVRHEWHTNNCESYFSLFKRGMNGVYQHCKEKHLHRYLAEFDFRYNNRVARGVSDEQRAAIMVKGAQGKRLTYRTTDSASAH